MNNIVTTDADEAKLKAKYLPIVEAFNQSTLGIILDVQREELLEFTGYLATHPELLHRKVAFNPELFFPQVLMYPLK